MKPYREIFTDPMSEPNNLDFDTITADELRARLPKATLDALVRQSVPWLTTVKGLMTMLANDTWESWQSSFIHFWSEFPAFVHEVKTWNDVPDNVMAYCHQFYRRTDGVIGAYIDISKNQDPEINARMILLFNQYIPMMFSIDGKTRLPEEESDKKD